MTAPRAPSEILRKWVHMGSAIIPFGFWLIGPELALPLLAAATVTVILGEVWRLNTQQGARIYQRYLGAMIRPHELRRPTGGVYLLVGTLAAALLFPTPIAILAMLFLCIGDPAAALIGMRYGRIRIGSKSLEGALACLMVCLSIALLAGVNGATAVVGAVAATLAELIPWTFVDDNLAIPLLSGSAMTMMIATGL